MAIPHCSLSSLLWVHFQPAPPSDKELLDRWFWFPGFDRCEDPYEIWLFVITICWYMLGYVAPSSLYPLFSLEFDGSIPPPPPHFPCFPRSNVLYPSVQSSPPPTMYVMGVGKTVIVACLLSGGSPLFMSYIFFANILFPTYFILWCYTFLVLCVGIAFSKCQILCPFPPPYQETLQGWGGGQHHYTDMYVYIYVGRSFIVCIAGPPPPSPQEPRLNLFGLIQCTLRIYVSGRLL